MGCNPAKDTQVPTLSQDTETLDDGLFGVEDLRPPLLPQPLGLETGPLGSARESESDPSEGSLLREPPRYSLDNSVASRSSDDGLPVAPSRL